MKKNLLFVILFLFCLITYGKENISLMSPILGGASGVNKIAPDSGYNIRVSNMFYYSAGTWLNVKNTYTNGKQQYTHEGEGTYGNIITEKEQSKTSAGAAYVNSDSTVYSYNSKGQKTGETQYTWDTTGNSWSKPVSYTYVYSLDTITELSGSTVNAKTRYYRIPLSEIKISYIQNSSSKKWYETDSTVTVYDSNNYPQCQITYKNDTSTNIKTPYMKMTYTYGKDVNNKDIVTARSSFWNNTSYGDTLYYGTTYKIAMTIEATYYYTLLTNAIETSIKNADNQSEVSIYPNPTTNGVYVKTGTEGKSDITIFDLNGNTILSKEVSAEEYISLGFLPQGVYSIRIVNTQGAYTRKLIKK